MSKDLKTKIAIVKLENVLVNMVLLEINVLNVVRIILGFQIAKVHTILFLLVHTFLFFSIFFFRAFLSSVLTYFSCLFTISDICKCNAEGSKDIDCNSQGLCECICNVVGPNCDKCAPGFYQFPNCKRKYTQWPISYLNYQDFIYLLFSKNIFNILWKFFFVSQKL